MRNQKPLIGNRSEQIADTLANVIDKGIKDGKDINSIMTDVNCTIPFAPNRDKLVEAVREIVVEKMPKKKLRDYVRDDHLQGVKDFVKSEKIDNSLLNDVKSLEVLLVLLENGYKIEVMDDFVYNILPEKGCFPILTYLNEKDLLSEKDISAIFYDLLLWEKARDEGYFDAHLEFALNLYKKKTGKDKLNIQEILQESSIGSFIAQHGL